MNATREEAERLYRLACRDQRAFAHLIAVGSPDDFSSAAFHAQQAMEKALKAALCLLGIEFRRCHDLLELSGMLKSAGLVIPVTEDALLRLTPYAVEFRYDDQAMPLITPAAAQSAVADCLDWCNRLIQEHP
jgi:HEPN domain-containing protein